MFSPKEVTFNYFDVCEGKIKTSVAKTFALALMAGIFIALAGVGSATAACSLTPPSIAKLVSALVFPGGLTMVILAGSELFTGNCMMVAPLASKRITLPAMLKSWVIVYIGNFIGSVLVAWIAVASHQLSNFDNALAVSAISTAVTKSSLTWSDAFLRAIACNFLVCIAVRIAFSAKTVGGKLAGLYFPIMLFVVSGFEHSIANMFYGPVGILAKGVPQYLQAAVDAGVNVDALTWGTFLLNNLLPVTLGNIIGGAAVGMVYWFCHAYGEKDA